MPNWCYNLIRIREGNAFQKIVEEYFTDGDLDFEKILPTPQELIDVSANGNGGLIFELLKNGVKYSGSDEKTYEEIARVLQELCPGIKPHKDLRYGLRHVIRYLRLGQTGSEDKSIKQKIENLLRYGAMDWYDWRCVNWGVKWSACNTYVDLEEKQIVFDTPWGPPQELIRKLSEITGSEIYSCYTEEQRTEYAGEFWVKNGEILGEFDAEKTEDVYKLWCKMNDADQVANAYIPETGEWFEEYMFFNGDWEFYFESKREAKEAEKRFNNAKPLDLEDTPLWRAWNKI